jgi:hypothetical protein
VIDAAEPQMRGYEVRLLSPDDQPALEQFLLTHADTSLFLRLYLGVGSSMRGNHFMEPTLLPFAMERFSALPCMLALAGLSFRLLKRRSKSPVMRLRPLNAPSLPLLDPEPRPSRRASGLAFQVKGFRSTCVRTYSRLTCPTSSRRLSYRPKACIAAGLLRAT